MTQNPADITGLSMDRIAEVISSALAQGIDAQKVFASVKALALIAGPDILSRVSTYRLDVSVYVTRRPLESSGTDPFAS